MNTEKNRINDSIDFEVVKGEKIIHSKIPIGIDMCR